MPFFIDSNGIAHTDLPEISQVPLMAPEIIEDDRDPNPFARIEAHIPWTVKRLLKLLLETFLVFIIGAMITGGTMGILDKIKTEYGSCSTK